MRGRLFTARDFLVGWRLLLREPGYSAVTVLGLALACAACYLLFGFVAWCLHYNGHVPQAERVYVVKQRINHFPRPDWNTNAMLFLRNTAIDSGMAGQASIFDPLDKPLRVGDALHEMTLAAVDPGFGTMFGIVPLAGDLDAALTRPDGLALTRSAALRLFGKEAALGATLRVGGEVLQVLALLPDVPANATQHWDALTGPLSRARPPAERVTRPTDSQHGQVLVKLHPGQQLEALTALMQQALDDSPFERRMRANAVGRAFDRPGTEAKLVALPDAYFDPDLASGSDARQHGRRDSVLALAGIALLILGLAVTNWINLSTVRTLRRQREIGMRKVLGAGAARVAAQFVAESVLVAGVAMAAGIVLAWLLLPAFAALVDRPLQGFFTPARLALGLACAGLAGVTAGLYPAWTALRVRPATVLAGRDSASETVGNLWLRRLLTVLQFAVAMALSAVTVAVGWQAWYASNADPGFDPARLSLLRLPDSSDAQVQALARALERVPGIQGAAVASEAVGRDELKIIGGFETRKGEDFRVEIKQVAPGFFDLYGMRPLAGRLFDPGRDRPGRGAVVLNMAAAQALGYRSAQEAVGQMPFVRDDAPDTVILGVAPDLRYQSLRERPGPLIYQVADTGSVITLRSALPIQKLTELVRPVWRQVYPDEVMRLQTASSVFAENYGTDLRMAQMLGAASTVALALSAFGIYVLSAYTVQRGRREIVIRKLYGAGNRAIALRLGREFGLSIGVAALIGLPLAALAIRHYLADFVEHAPFGQWPLVAGLAVAALAALLAVARHTGLAMRMSPVQALHD